jgi:hypothetical protein
VLRVIDALGSKDRFSKVQERHWQRFAEFAGLSWAQTRKRVIRMAAQLPSMARRLQAEVQAEFRVFVQHWREALVEVFSAALTRVKERSPKTKMDS